MHDLHRYYRFSMPSSFAAWVAGLVMGVTLGGAAVVVAAPRPWRNALTPTSRGVSVSIQPVLASTDAGPQVEGYRAIVDGCVTATDPTEPDDCEGVVLAVPPEHNAKARAVLVWGLTQAASSRNINVSTSGLP